MNLNMIHINDIYSYPWQLVLSLFIIISKLYMVYSLKIECFFIFIYYLLCFFIIHYFYQFMLLIAYALEAFLLAYTKYGSR